MGRENLRLIGKFKQLVVQAVVKHGGKLLWSVIAGKVGAAHVSYKQRIPGEHSLWPGSIAQVGHRNTNALQRMTGCAEKIEAALPELNGIAIFDGSVRERGA